MNEEIYNPGIKEECIKLSMDLLVNNVIPTLEILSEHTNVYFETLKKVFNDDYHLLIFIINAIDNKIKNILINSLNESHNIIDTFVDKCLPIIMSNRKYLITIYNDEYAFPIIEKYLTDIYSKTLLTKININNILSSRIIVSSFIETIKASMTYYSHMSYDEIKEQFLDTLYYF